MAQTVPDPFPCEGVGSGVNIYMCMCNCLSARTYAWLTTCVLSSLVTRSVDKSGQMPPFLPFHRANFGKFTYSRYFNAPSLQTHAVDRVKNDLKRGLLDESDHPQFQSCDHQNINMPQQE